MRNYLIRCNENSNKKKIEIEDIVYNIMCSVVSSSLWPNGLWPARLFFPWNFPGKNTRAGFDFLLQGIFPTQGSGLLSPIGRQILYHWATWESPHLFFRIRLMLWIILLKLNSPVGLSWLLSGKESTCQWRRWVRSLIQEDFTHLRATKPMWHNCWACALEPGSHKYWSPHALEPVFCKKTQHRQKWINK